jgi:general secretion pathway protein H
MRPGIGIRDSGFGKATAPLAFCRCDSRFTIPDSRRCIPESRIPNPASRPTGFTLIELLVVVVILAVLAAAVSIGFAGAGGERTLAREAERAQALIAYACERAELSGRDIGLAFAKSGYRFSYPDRDVWTPYRSDELRPRAWPAAINAVLTQNERRITLAATAPDKPQLLCYASGELTPFRIELSLPDLARRYRLDGQANGQVLLATIDAGAR